METLKKNDHRDNFVESLRRQLVEAIEENKKLRFMVENGLGYEDLKNDIKYPAET